MVRDERIRVLFVVPNLQVGGAERHLTHLLPLMDRERFEPMVCCIKDRGALYDRIEAAGVPAVAFGHGTRDAPRSLAELLRLIRRLRPHVVVARGFNAETLGLAAATLARVPVRVVWKHNCGDLHRPLRQRLGERVIDRMTDSYFGVAWGQIPYLVNELGIAGHKIRIIQNGVEPDAYDLPRDEAVARELGIAPGEPVVSILAVMRPEKDHANFLRAGRRIVDAMPSARLLLVGDGPERPRLEALAAQLGLGDRAIFTGMRSDVGKLLNLSDVVVLSSFTIECFPFSVLEAMSARVPAVCTAIGGLPEMIEDGVTGHLAPPRDPDGLAEGVLRVLATEGRAAEMGRAARRRLEAMFTLDRSVRETERVFETLVARAARS